MRSKLTVLALLVTGCLYGLFFTPLGNDMLLPYLNRYLAKKLPRTTHLRIESFRLKPKSLEASLRYNDQIDLHLDGPIDLLKRAFAFEYTVKARRLQWQKSLIPHGIDIQGKIEGTAEKIALSGAGEIAGSKIDFHLEKEGEIFEGVVVHIHGADLKTLELIAGIPPYMSGVMDLQITMPRLSGRGEGAKTTLRIRNGRVQHRLLKRDFNLTLPKDFGYSMGMEGILYPKEGRFEGAVHTTVGDVILSDIRLDFSEKRVKSAYGLKIPDLAKLDGLTPLPMRGAFEMDGTMVFEKGFYLEGESGSLGGALHIVFTKGESRVKMERLHLKKLLYLLRYPLVAKGDVSGRIVYDIAHRSGKVETTMERLVLLPNRMTEILRQLGHIDLTKERYNLTRLDAQIMQERILFTLDAKSERSHLRLMDAKLNGATKRIDAKFTLSYEEKDFSGRIEGDIRHPKVVFDSSKYLEKRIRKEAKRQIKKRITEKTKERLQKRLNEMGFEETNATKGIERGVKGLIEGLFH